MERETARQEIRSRIKCTDYLEKSKGGLYCCPFCGSGTGTHATGALKVYDTNTFTCHACHKSGDVIDLYREHTGTDYNTALSLLAQEIGITIDPYRPTAADDFGGGAKNDRENGGRGGVSAQGNDKARPDEKPATGAGNAPQSAEQDFITYYMDCMKRLQDPAAMAYLQSRGISYDNAINYGIGYDPAADPAQSNHPCPRIIIPTSPAHYIGRRIDGVKDYAKLNSKGSSPAIFNGNVLARDVQEVFVTEGAFDALSVIEAGAAAISLNSAANYDALIKQLERERTGATLILCLDNDAAGAKAAETLRAGLQRLNISYITADICGGYKDPNEHLQADRAGFFAAVERARRQAAARPDNTAYYIDTLMQGEIERFKADKKTGWANLDAKAGGLYSGLYVLAAISSLGKTSFVLQLADQLAERGNDVLFFSLEQSRLELVSKSLARRMAQTDMATAITSLQIRKGQMPQLVRDTAQEYKKAVADRISIIEGNFACTISFIGDYVRQYVRRTGARPVCIIDYLQILQPLDDAKRQTTKETVDTTITQLKRISRELDLTIIAISSVNRANYLTPIDFEALKESGSIEFSADVVWGLQLQCLNNDPVFEKETGMKQKREKIREAKAANPRKIELCALKNRYGIANYSCYFNYYPANDLFAEDNDHAVDDFAERIGAYRL